MARGNPGKIVTWTDKEGAKKYGIAYNKEQEQSFINIKKMFVRYVLDNLTTREKDPHGRHIAGLVAIEKLKLIGHVD